MPENIQMSQCNKLDCVDSADIKLLFPVSFLLTAELSLWATLHHSFQRLDVCTFKKLLF